MAFMYFDTRMGTYSYSRQRLSSSYKIVSSLIKTLFSVIFLDSLDTRMSYWKLVECLGRVCLMRIRLVGSG